MPFLSSSILSLVRICVYHSFQNGRWNALILLALCCILDVMVVVESNGYSLLVGRSLDWDGAKSISVEVLCHPETVEFELNRVTGWGFRLSL